MYIRLVPLVGAGFFLVINGTRENIALNKPADQSTTLNFKNYLWNATLATDGNTEFSLTCRCCSGTNNYGQLSWWEVNLGKEYDIGRIDVYGRNDNQTTQLQGFDLYISNSSQQTWTNLRSVYHDSETSVTQYQNRRGHYIIKVGDIRGQYVSVTYNERTLVICELQVFTACPAGHYEPNCTACDCGGRPCNKTDGTCLECPAGTYGVSCSPCGHCLQGNTPCDKVTGQCSGGCAAGYTGSTCDQECPNPTFGPNCSGRCHCYNNEHCNHTTGDCPTGCEVGYFGSACSTECANQTFGLNCSGTCHCHNNEQCNHTDGLCLNGCEIGYAGQNCSTDEDLLPKIRQNLTVSMSTPVYQGMNASLAIDGSERTELKCNCCSVTTSSSSWWRLELGQMYVISGVKLFGRSDQANHNSNYTLRLSNTLQSGEAFGDLHPVPGKPYVFYTHLSNIVASTITIDRATLLVICEIKVYEGDCGVGYYDRRCNHECHCVDNKPCNRTSGTCSTPGCKPGWMGQACNKECYYSSFGPNCSHTCHCINGSHCDHVTGTCDFGRCESGWQGPSCDRECNSPSFGPSCSRTCHCLNKSHCNHVNGTCDTGLCDPGWRESSCDQECDSSSFGPNCPHTCHCINGSHCDHVTGTCDRGLCDPGWQGPSCDQECSSPSFGTNCSHTCHCGNGSQCDHVIGTCGPGLCAPGWTGPSCDQEKQDPYSVLQQTKNQDGSDCMGHVIVVVVLAVTCVAQTVCLAVLWARLRNMRQKNNNRREEDKSVPKKSYVNEMVEITANIQNVPEDPENHYQPVVNVDSVGVDVQSDYQGLCYRDNAEGAYSMLKNDSKHALNTASNSVDVHGYTNLTN